jgi:rhodanese-related sulfurtransferase/DNA-binding transcriptional ArsR family regulator
MASPSGNRTKQDLFDQFARIGRALASGRRLEILDFLAQRERSVEELARMSGLSIANASQHLQVLRTAGLVEARKEGTHVHYRLAGDDVFALCQSLRTTGETRLAEIEKLVGVYRKDRNSLEAISLQELRRRMREGSVLVLDVRPAEEYADGHIPGARNIPLAELKNSMKGLPEECEIVAYCRGPYCFLSDDAVAALRQSGRKALRLSHGFPDWKALGWKVEGIGGGRTPV